jgi:hypothetical protein
VSRAISIETGCDWCDFAPVPEDEAVVLVIDGREVDLCDECGRIILDLASKGRKPKPGAKPKRVPSKAAAVNQCGQCGKAYPTAMGLSIHTGRMHKGAKP